MKVLYALALIAAVPAAAQEVQQTPEGAARFLQLTSQSHRVAVIPSYYAWPTIDLAYSVVGFSTAAPCATNVATSAGAVTLGNRLPVVTIQSMSPKAITQFEELARASGVRLPPYQIDWSQVSRVAQVASGGARKTGTASQQRRYILVEGRSVRLVFSILGDDAIMKRMIYAMQFLKVACDHTAETGF